MALRTTLLAKVKACTQQGHAISQPFALRDCMLQHCTTDPDTYGSKLSKASSWAMWCERNLSAHVSRRKDYDKQGWVVWEHGTPTPRMLLLHSGQPGAPYNPPERAVVGPKRPDRELGKLALIDHLTIPQELDSLFPVVLVGMMGAGKSRYVRNAFGMSARYAFKPPPHALFVCCPACSLMAWIQHWYMTTHGLKRWFVLAGAAADVAELERQFGEGNVMQVRCQHTNAPTHQHTNAPTHQHTNAPTPHHTNTPTRVWRQHTGA